MPASAIVPPVEPQRGAGGGDGPVAGAALDLLVGAAGAVAQRDADLDEHLGVADRRLVRAAVELAIVDDALAARPRMTTRRAERGAHRREVLGRVGLAQRAADRAAVAHRPGRR